MNNKEVSILEEALKNFTSLNNEDKYRVLGITEGLIIAGGGIDEKNAKRG